MRLRFLSKVGKLLLFCTIQKNDIALLLYSSIMKSFKTYSPFYGDKKSKGYR